MHYVGGVAGPGTEIALRDTDRCNLPESNWVKKAEQQEEARNWASGTAAHRQIPISGAVNLQSHFSSIISEPFGKYK